jgi:hypothetical protein
MDFNPAAAPKERKEPKMSAVWMINFELVVIFYVLQQDSNQHYQPK